MVLARRLRAKGDISCLFDHLASGDKDGIVGPSTFALLRLIARSIFRLLHRNSGINGLAPSTKLGRSRFVKTIADAIQRLDPVEFLVAFRKLFT